jgi:hypothetical protein
MQNWPVYGLASFVLTKEAALPELVRIRPSDLTDSAKGMIRTVSAMRKYPK